MVKTAEIEPMPVDIGFGILASWDLGISAQESAFFAHANTHTDHIILILSVHVTW